MTSLARIFMPKPAGANAPAEPSDAAGKAVPLILASSSFLTEGQPHLARRLSELASEIRNAAVRPAGGVRQNLIGILDMLPVEEVDAHDRLQDALSWLFGFRRLGLDETVEPLVDPESAFPLIANLQAQISAGAHHNALAHCRPALEEAAYMYGLDADAAWKYHITRAPAVVGVEPKSPYPHEWVSVPLYDGKRMRILDLDGAPPCTWQDERGPHYCLSPILARIEGLWKVVGVD